MCILAGLPKPSFDTEFGGLQIEFVPNPVTPESTVKEKTGVKTSGKVTGNASDSASEKVSDKMKDKMKDKTSMKMTVEMTEKIINLIKNNSEKTIIVLADQIGKSQSTIERKLKNLQKANKIERIGPAKGGYWKVNE